LVNAGGSVFRNGREAVTLSKLPQRFDGAAAKQPQPELHRRADRLVHYEKVARVVVLAATAGLARIRFPSDPVLE